MTRLEFFCLQKTGDIYLLLSRDIFGIDGAKKIGKSRVVVAAALNQRLLQALDFVLEMPNDASLNWAPTRPFNDSPSMLRFYDSSHRLSSAPHCSAFCAAAPWVPWLLTLDRAVLASPGRLSAAIRSPPSRSGRIRPPREIDRETLQLPSDRCSACARSRCFPGCCSTPASPPKSRSAAWGWSFPYATWPFAPRIPSASGPAPATTGSWWTASAVRGFHLQFANYSWVDEPWRTLRRKVAFS